MQTKLHICPVIELPNNSRLTFLSNLGVEVVVINNQGQYIAFNRKCPHKGARLDKSLIDDNTLICDAHQYEFDLATGACINYDCPSIKTYTVLKEGNNLYLVVESQMPFAIEK